MSDIASLVGSERILGATVRRELPLRNELILSGLTVSNEDTQAVASGGPRIADLPMINPLSTAEYNISTDNINDQGRTGKISAKRYKTVRHDLNYGWTYTDLTGIVTKYNQRGGIEAGVTDYWAGITNKFLVAGIDGALGAAPSLSLDLTEFSLDSVIDASSDAGVHADLMKILFVGPQEYAKARRDQAGFRPASETESRLANWHGYTLVQTTKFGPGKVVMARLGSVAYDVASPAGLVETEIERVAGGGSGGGGEKLWDRKSFVIAPQGFHYNGEEGRPHTGVAASEGVQAVVGFDDPANWSVALANVKDIGFRMLNIG